MSRRRKPPRRTTSSGAMGRPRRGDEFSDEVLREKLRQIWRDLGGATPIQEVYDEAIRRGLFSTHKLAQFAQRAALEFIRGALGAIDRDTGRPYGQYVPGASIGQGRGNGSIGRQLWILEVLMTPTRWNDHFDYVFKAAQDDRQTIARDWIYAVQQHGAQLILPWPDELGPAPV